MPYIFFAWPVAGATWIVFLGESFLENLRIATGQRTP
jgi:hypothetical protein